MSRIGIFKAAGICYQVEHSIYAMFLRGHTFKTYKVGWPEECYLRCNEEVTCQSYNFHIGKKVCELNNRTKEARPEDFMADQTKFYMKLTFNRGTFFHPHLSLYSKSITLNDLLTDRPTDRLNERTNDKQTNERTNERTSGLLIDVTHFIYL